MSENQPSVSVTIDNSNGTREVLRIVATLLACGAFVAIAWALSKNGWLDLAATGLTVWSVNFARNLFNNGLLKLPEGRPRGEVAFEDSLNILQTLRKDLLRFMERSSVLRLAVVSMAYTVVFMLLRQLMVLGLHIFTNIWIAAAAGALFAAVIVAPQMFSKTFRAVNAASKAANQRVSRDNSTEKEN